MNSGRAFVCVNIGNDDISRGMDVRLTTSHFLRVQYRRNCARGGGKRDETDESLSQASVVFFVFIFFLCSIEIYRYCRTIAKNKLNDIFTYGLLLRNFVHSSAI